VATGKRSTPGPSGREPSGGNTPPKGGKTTSSNKKCANDHVANSEGKCFTDWCPYYVRAGG